MRLDSLHSSCSLSLGALLWTHCMARIIAWHNIPCIPGAELLSARAKNKRNVSHTIFGALALDPTIWPYSRRWPTRTERREAAQQLWIVARRSGADARRHRSMRRPQVELECVLKVFNEPPSASLDFARSIRCSCWKQKTGRREKRMKYNTKKQCSDKGILKLVRFAAREQITVGFLIYLFISTSLVASRWAWSCSWNLDLAQDHDINGRRALSHVLSVALGPRCMCQRSE